MELEMGHRLRFTARKLVRMALLLLGVSLTAFLLMDASPLDPLQTNIGMDISHLAGVCLIY